MKSVHAKWAALLGCVLTTAAIAEPAASSDWSQWRGSNGDGKAASFTPPAAWPKELAQKWKTAVGEGVSTPALVGDKLYVFARQDGNEIVRCLNAADGKEIWQDKYQTPGANGPASGFSGPRSSPAVADGKVVVLGLHGTLSCLDAGTGKVAWRKDEFQGATPRFQTSSSPIIVDGMCIAQLGGQGNGAVVAYDLATGTQKWKTAGDSPAYASPAVMTVGGTKLVIAETERMVVAMNLSDGKEVWSTPFAAQGMGAYNASSPAVNGQTLIYSGGGRGTHAVRLEKTDKGITGKELWANADKSLQFSSPIVKEGLLYGLSGANELFCINVETGKTAWSNALGGAGAAGGPGVGRPRGPGGQGAPGGPPGGGAPGGGGAGAPGGGAGAPGGGRPRGGRGMGGGGGAGYGSLIDAGKVLLVLTPAGELIVVQPGEKQYTEQARIKVAATPTYAYPVVSGQRIVIKDQDSVSMLTVE